MQSHIKKLRPQLESDLSKISTENNLVNRYDQSIRAVISCIEELKTHLKTYSFRDDIEEIGYFKTLAPYFYSQYFYYNKLLFGELQRRSCTDSSWNLFLKQDLQEINRFFIVNGEFIRYYYSGSTIQDERYFKRGAKDYWIHEDIGMILNEHFCVGSYLVSRLLVYERYRSWLENELQKIARPESKTSKSIDKYEWKESKSAAVELIKSLAETQSIYINNTPATAARLTKDFENKYCVNLDDFDKLLYATDTRKTDETPFLNKLISSFLGRKKRLRK